MDLTTSYMGLKLSNPLVASASPLSQNLDNFKKLEDAGISAIVNHSLFEEQIRHEAMESQHFSDLGTDSFAESLSFFPAPNDFVIGPEAYLTHLEKAKKSVGIPVIGSLNGHTTGGWTKYAKRIAETGVDALELNIYHIPTDASKSAAQVEQTYIEILRQVKSEISIPVAVKLNPYFSSMANMAQQLDAAGADALVLFNRFYQPDIDLESLEVTPNLILSTPQAMRLPLRWAAILHGQVKASLAVTSGVHKSEDVVKMIMAGADVTMLCSVLLRNGIEQASTILEGVKQWMSEHEYESVEQMKGSMSHQKCSNPEAFERANYMKVLQSYR